MKRLTPLHESHIAIGARMVDFAGWEMPVQYSGPAAEHMAVREAAGLFDVSHMGEIEIQGPGAGDLVQYVTTNDVRKLQDNQVQYSALTNQSGGILDDVLVYRINSEYYLIVANAANTEKDFAWIRGKSDGFDAEVHNTSSGYVLLALQGPRAEPILQDLCDHVLDRIPYYWSQRVKVDGIDCRVSRTGYTGEDGFEIFCHPENGRHLWNRLLVTGHSLGLAPCGLAARNTLRLEAAYRLWGNDMDEQTTPLEAGLGWIVKLGKGDFVGKSAIERQKREGLRRRLAGFEGLEKAPVRDGYPVVDDGQQIGVVTSGSPAPFLKKNIGFAYLPLEKAAIGTSLSAIVRGKEVEVRVVETPFYRRERRTE